MATTEGTLLTANETPKPFLLDCSNIDIRFKEYAVSTSNKQVKDLIKLYRSRSREKVVLSYKGSYHNLIQYTDEELNSHYENNTQEWQDWCNDVAIYHTSKFVLYSKSYSIFKDEEEYEEDDEEDDDDEEALIKALEKDMANKKKEKEETLKKEKEERLKKEAKEAKEADKKKEKEKFKKQLKDDEELIQAVQEQKAKTKKQTIQDLTRQANKKKAKEERLRKEFEESAAKAELEKLKEKKKKQKHSSKA
jgi:hypothetical protein